MYENRDEQLYFNNQRDDNPVREWTGIDLVSRHEILIEEHVQIMNLYL